MLGICVEEMPPQVCGVVKMTCGFAVFCSKVFVAAMSRTNAGRADQSTAITPATCGPAIDVPLRLPKLVSLVLVAERTFTPGAEMFGFKTFGV